MDKEPRVTKPTAPKPVKEKRPPKTLKERLFVREYLKSGNGTQAALKVYDTKDYGSAHSIAYENLQKLAISDLMDERGLTDDRLIEVLDDGLNANRVISAVNTDNQATGATTDFIEVPDHAIRHKYLETAFKLKDKFPSKTVGIETTDGEKTVRVIIKDF